MAKLVYALNVSLDGYVDHMKFVPDPVLFHHFIEDVRSLSGMVYGRRMYEIMRYWDEEQPGWTDAEREYAVAWRGRPKWVVSRTMEQVGPNATLLATAWRLRSRNSRLPSKGRSRLQAQRSPHTSVTPVSSMNIGFMCTRLCLAAARHSFRAHAPACGSPISCRSERR